MKQNNKNILTRESILSGNIHELVQAENGSMQILTEQQRNDSLLGMFITILDHFKNSIRILFASNAMWQHHKIATIEIQLLILAWIESNSAKQKTDLSNRQVGSVTTN